MCVVTENNYDPLFTALLEKRVITGGFVCMLELAEVVIKSVIWNSKASKVFICAT